MANLPVFLVAVNIGTKFHPSSAVRLSYRVYKKDRESFNPLKIKISKILFFADHRINHHIKSQMRKSCGCGDTVMGV